MKKTVLISGASRGIGRELAIKFAKEGYHLSLCTYRNMAMLQELKVELEEMGAEVLIKQCDITKDDEVQEWINSTYQRFTTIDVLVSNAGIAHYSLLVDTSEKDYDRIMDTNLKGSFLLAKAVYDGMVSQKSGSIIFVSSIWGKHGASFESVYSASKAGLIGLSKSLAKELAPSNIRVNTVLPGAVQTDMLSILNEEELKELACSIPIQRIANTKEIADVIYFLASDSASYITGAEISVDGGF